MMSTPFRQPIPYLMFNGDCAEAIEFYAATLGATISTRLNFGQMPGTDQMPPEIARRVVNAQLELPGGAWMYAGDTAPHMGYNGIHGIGLALIYESLEEAEKVFSALAESEGSAVVMPFARTMWAEAFGMVTDKYGVDWMINFGMQKM